ncbi:MAG: hypothetical protein K6A63_03820 [Acholeplasmatales bacterium]|nr:hypothetical protein [Acholeplasmatales bacterium]
MGARKLLGTFGIVCAMLALGACGTTSDGNESGTNVVESSNTTASSESTESNATTSEAEASTTASESSTSESVASSSTLGTEEGYEVTVSLGSHVSITFYETQTYTTELTDTTVTYSRDGTTGELLNDGNGQVNFKLTFDSGYELDELSVTGSYNKIKNSSTDPDSIGEGYYRITKIASNLSISITSKLETEADTGYIVTFVTDDNSSIKVYATQDYTVDPTEAESTESVDSTTGDPVKDGTGQVNFLVVLGDGYLIDSISIDGSYGNLKGSADTGISNVYRITKIASDLTVTITTKVDDGSIDAYSATFDVPDGVTITVYETQDTTSSSTVTTTAYSRSGTTGEYLSDGTGQVNFLVNCPDGYEVDTITVTPTENYTNLKNTATGLYRITKITGDITITITIKTAA